MKRQATVQMTEGPIWKQLLLFALPLMLGNVFQQFYNTVDAAVVGNFVGPEALAAVGSTGSIINTVICFSIGLSTGAAVVISQYYGARDWAKLRVAVHTTVMMTLILSVALTILSVPLVPLMLKAMQTPPEVFYQAQTYLQIYFSGLVGTLMYNTGAGILRAVGDSTRPLLFLILSAVLNVVFDLVFVLGLGMKIEGVAYATVLTQFIAMGLTFTVLARAHGEYRVRWRELHIHMPTLKLVLKIGIPTVVQQVLTSFSNVFVQGYINAFGASCMAGWTSYGKVDAFALLPIQSLSMASTTFVGQNVGAGQMERAKKGVGVAMKVTLAVTAVLILGVNLMANPLLRIFNQDPEVLEFGLLFVRMMSPFYFLCVINQIIAGALRGAGDTKAPMYIMLISFVAFRQLYLYVTSTLSGAVEWVALAYPSGWILASAILLIYYYRSDWTKKSITARRPE